MKHDINVIRQLLIKHRNNKSAVAREMGINRSNLNRYLRKMYSEGMVDENYNVSLPSTFDRERYNRCIEVFGENRVIIEDGEIICYMVDPEDDDLSIEELEEKYDGFNG